MKRHILFDDDHEKRGPNECWPWTGLVTKDGYGRYWDPARKCVVGAHRFAWMRLNGPIPRGLQVCHRCDNPNCVNPKHLFLGTFRENMNDMRHKKRHVVPIAPDNRGSKHGMSKLTEKDVLDILQLRSQGWILQKIADKYGLSISIIANICNGKSWGHITATVPLLIEACREQSHRYRQRHRESRPPV